MEKLRDYLNSLTPEQQAELAAKAGTSVGYLRKVLSIEGARLGVAICIGLERATCRALLVDDLRPDLIDHWNYLRGSEKAA